MYCFRSGPQGMVVQGQVLSVHHIPPGACQPNDEVHHCIIKLYLKKIYVARI